METQNLKSSSRNIQGFGSRSQIVYAWIQIQIQISLRSKDIPTLFIIKGFFFFFCIPANWAETQKRAYKHMRRQPIQMEKKPAQVVKEPT